MCQAGLQVLSLSVDEIVFFLGTLLSAHSPEGNSPYPCPV